MVDHQLAAMRSKWMQISTVGRKTGQLSHALPVEGSILRNRERFKRLLWIFRDPAQIVGAEKKRSRFAGKRVVKCPDWDDLVPEQDAGAESVPKAISGFIRRPIPELLHDACICFGDAVCADKGNWVKRHGRQTAVIGILSAGAVLRGLHKLPDAPLGKNMPLAVHDCDRPQTLRQEAGPVDCRT